MNQEYAIPNALLSGKQNVTVRFQATTGMLGGIYGGVFTPTEAGAVAFAASVVVACAIHGDVKWRELPGLLVEIGFESPHAVIKGIFGVHSTLKDKARWEESASSTLKLCLQFAPCKAE